MRQGRPLIYLHGVAKGKYVPAWPVFIVSDNPTNLTFTVAVDEKETVADLSANVIADSAGEEARRRYATSVVRVRLHQRTFRARVLAAYREQCALCRLRHIELLEAAHITPDSDESGEPLVSNGVALCTLHHAAFDGNILGIRPDLVVEIRLDILKEVDGPMLRHGLQEMHGAKIRVPKRPEHQPNPHALAQRYEQFRAHS